MPQITQLKENPSNEPQVKSTHVSQIVDTLVVSQADLALQRIQSNKTNPIQMKQDMMLLQRSLGNRAVVQLLAQRQKQEQVSDVSTVKDIAAAGVQGKGNQLPHYDKIHASFGSHDISHVQAYTNSTATAASRAIGAEAYATGHKIAFAESSPDLFTTAHEAAHTIQQQKGVQLKNGIGEPNDIYESQADSVANLVVQGKSAEQALSSAAMFSPSLNFNAVQRKISKEKYVNDDDGKTVNEYATKLDTAVNKAYAGILNTPLLGMLAELDGHTKQWKNKIEHLASKNENPGFLPASFGYAIESIATGPLLPSSPAGYSIIKQGIRGSTRPDVILSKNAEDVGWLDITASDSAGHIFDKAGGWEQISNYAEVTYPSLELANVAEMAKKVATTKDDEPNFGVDIASVMAQAKAAHEAFLLKKEHWKQLGKDWFAEVLKIGGDSLLRYVNRRKAVITILNNNIPGLGLDIEEDEHKKIAANLLYAMDLNPASYGFDDSVDRVTGEAMLQDINP